jgi:hypothetical protein
MGMKRNVILLVLVVALSTAFMAAQSQNCELMDGARHAAMSCPAAVFPVPLALGLMVLSLVPLTTFTSQGQFVLASIYRPPRRALVR